jgi:uncharacterized membrane protein
MKRKVSSRAFWGLTALLATWIALTASRYFFATPAKLAPQGGFGAHFARYFPLLLLHVIGGVVALVLGPWQFSEWVRQRNLRLHRWMGRAYLIAVLVGSIAGLAMATVSLGGLVTHIGFGLLAGLWLLTALFAYVRIRHGEIDSHREWMTRNYALTFAAVTLRLWLPFFARALHVEIMQAYMTVSWLAWVPNLLVAEVLINQRRRLLNA